MAYYAQSQIDGFVNDIVNSYTNQSIAYHGTYQGECSVPAAYYIEKFTGQRAPSMYAARADGWGVSFPGELAAYFARETFQAGKVYPRGTILMWNSPHIAIVLHSDGTNTVTVFEQNADPDGAPCKTANRVINNAFHTCTYALIPIIQVEAAPLPYTVQPVDPFTAWTTHEATVWHLNYTTWADMNAFAVGQRPSSDAVQVVAKTVGHPLGEFWLYDTEAPAGFLSTDMTTTDPTPAPKPYIPPTGAETIKLAETYKLVTTVPYFPDAPSAFHDRGALGSLPEGSYFIFSKDGTGMLNLTSNNQKNLNHWVNPAQNVPPAPKPEVVPVEVKPLPLPSLALKPSEVPIGLPNDTKWKASYASFNADRSPDIYEVLQDYTMKEYGGQRGTVSITKGKRLNTVGTFVKDGVKFYRPRDYKNDVNFIWYYGIPLFDDDNNPMMRKVVEEPLPQHFMDIFRLWRDDLANYLGDKPIWDIFIKKKGVKK